LFGRPAVSTNIVKYDPKRVKNDSGGWGVRKSRREFLAGIGGLAALGVVQGGGSSQLSSLRDASSPAAVLPARSAFAIPEDVTYVNSGFTHPMPIVAAQAMRSYVDYRAEPGLTLKQSADIKSEFAALINAKPSEISLVPNTSTGENLVVNGLGIPHAHENVVTDALHFEGALLHLGELQQRNGLELRIVQPRHWRIDMRDLERAVDKKTKLVEISLVSMVNGFQHDLKRFAIWRMRMALTYTRTSCRRQEPRPSMFARAIWISARAQVTSG
jgi:hypothetical protein